MPESKIKQAANLFRDFTGHIADSYQKMDIQWPDVGMIVGECEGIAYNTVRDGNFERYYHEFKKSARPLLIAAHDGSVIGVVGGNYLFTDRGITDQ